MSDKKTIVVEFCCPLCGCDSFAGVELLFLVPTSPLLRSQQQKGGRLERQVCQRCGITLRKEYLLEHSARIQAQRQASVAASKEKPISGICPP